MPGPDAAARTQQNGAELLVVVWADLLVELLRPFGSRGPDAWEARNPPLTRRELPFLPGVRPTCSYENAAPRLFREATQLKTESMTRRVARAEFRRVEA